MWTSRNATASSEALRWTASNTNRGTATRARAAHVGDAERDADRQQDQRDAPVPRVRYQSAVGLIASAAMIMAVYEPPETTGAGAGAGWLGAVAGC